MSPHEPVNSKTVHRRLDRAIHLGVAQAVAEHKKAGRPIHVMKKGQIVCIGKVARRNPRMAWPFGLRFCMSPRWLMKVIFGKLYKPEDTPVKEEKKR